MKLTSRYSHRYNAFLDGLYICELCDTDDLKEFVKICIDCGQMDGFTAYIDGEKVTEEN